MKKTITLFIFLSAASLFADKPVENRSYIPPSSAAAKTATSNAQPGNSSFSKTNINQKTKSSYAEYQNDKNRAAKELTEYVKKNVMTNPAAKQKVEQLNWETKRQSMKMDDGEKTLDFKNNDIAVGGMKDGESSISMGQSIGNAGAVDGTYDIGNN